MEHDLEFVASGRGQAQCPSNPEYPSGIIVDATDGEMGCVVKLPYPAPECGHFRVSCKVCRMSVAITAAGRADDPTSVKIPCRLSKEAH